MPLLPEHSAPQHERAPRPLPLFLELVREVSERDPELGRAALAGLRGYEQAPRRERPPPKPEIARVRGVALRDHGGSGPPAVLVPSLINPPRILDLDDQVSLTAAIARMGRRALLLDWGKADERADLSVAGHIEELLLPVLRSIGEPVALIGYCLGGTMAIAAARFIEIERVATIAAPWRFAAYPEGSRRALADMWRHSEGAAKQLGALPMEVLQAAFWSLDPERTVRKFAEFGRLDPASADARRFVELEEWANEGEPLPYPAARELIEDLFGRDLPGSGQWIASDKLAVPALHLTADHDRIAPAATAPAGDRIAIPSGHVGMIVGSARERLQHALAAFLSG
ncbi:MAG TPA: alpha/beta hydrolase [Sphingomicrobium sp.]|nr:alpha/beta hydrolase [Sphingomicrobium sp.]